MASWKKYFKVYNGDTSGNTSPLGGSYDKNASPVFRNYQSNLPDVYIGHPNRIDRYNQYEQMDMDSEINAALDILADFCTQNDPNSERVFSVFYNDTPTENEVKIITEQLNQWINLNELDQRMFKLFRNTIKYGDQVFIRDPETFKLHWTEIAKVVKIIVNESEGKHPEQFVIKDLSPNFETLTSTKIAASDLYVNRPQMGGSAGSYSQPQVPYGGGSRFTKELNECAIDAKHIVHLSMSEGLDPMWPFGTSILENIFKVFKQKELIEDAVIIYRVQRAPERRIFKIDVGSMVPHMAMAYVERIKNEIHQRRIPTMNGGSGNMTDATYNPLSTLEDFFFPTTAEGRGSSVEVLPGGCLSMDTKVVLLDGRTLSLSELTSEYKSGKQNWTFSANPETGEIVPGIISWAGVTQKSAKVVRLTLDNGETIVCTPDHKFPILGKGLIRADELGINEKFITKDAVDIFLSSIEFLPDNIEVGTLTIDTDEKYHDYHNFALSVGVITQNSNLGEITDLKFFSNKLFRGLRIPSSYLPQDSEDGSQSFNDGRVGTALIQEWTFNQYCKRLQKQIIPNLDREFKMFLRWRGVNIDNSLFKLVFNEPQNFAKYRQVEIDTARIGTFSQVESYPYLSKRFMLQRFLGLSEEEIAENERMWKEENPAKTVDSQEEDTGLRGVGITPGDVQSDIDMFAGDELENLAGVDQEADLGITPSPVGGQETPPAGTQGV